MPNPNTVTAPTINIGQTITATLLPQDSNGNQGTLQAGDVPSWSVTSGPVTVAPASNGLTATITPTGPGSYAIAVQADSNFNGGTQLNLTINGTVSENPASSLSASFTVNN